MWDGKSISVVLPTYNERDSIRSCIEDFSALGIVDEIIVVNNNAALGTDEEVRRTQAKLVHEPRQGYGYSVRRGLEEAAGDYIVLSEPDGTFEARDIFKLIAYADDFDVVLGSRTVANMIWEGANMNFFLKWGNWAVAKMIEFLFNGTNFTDVGCTMRLIKSKGLARIKDGFTVGGNHFSPEFIILCLAAGLNVTMIPLNYKKRVGVSMGSGTMLKAVGIGARMIGLIMSYRLRLWLRGVSGVSR
ncbi:MAG: glycosyltransferase family 2 protein [Chloroflexi bacterium]|nr:glycosyltransferase family 2 protein [Chloroflexota bacterium]